MGRAVGASLLLAVGMALSPRGGLQQLDLVRARPATVGGPLARPAVVTSQTSEWCAASP